MTLSMTGYGKAQAEIGKRKISIELRSLNSKQLDLSLRIPSLLKEKETEIRSEIQKRLERGKIDLLIQVEAEQADTSCSINRSVLEAYYRDILETAGILRINPPSDPWPALLKLPDVLKGEHPDMEAQEWTALMQVLDQAIDQLNAFRKQEGEMLETFFLNKLQAIESLLRELETYETERIDKVKSRLEEGLQKVAAQDYDRNRFEQELIYYIEKLDVSEEKSRLINHCEYFKTTLSTEGKGKKLGFIVQEMGREINTLGSKANHSEMQRLVVCMKDELEQIKEQVLNVL
ncbi:MAG: YicC family protein [Bacteroidales bacterium]|nr:YicC family protein [Bacteroidales bacterium]MDD3431684.1 YicC family protein [Bacteroidales bacterium]MDD4361487.1 YicC family protein [Bacteroidales bacterium]MDD4430492.1 YicC family protein [Bacteroidales bacterium]